MPATEDTVPEYATRYGISEDIVRDIAGISAPEPITVTLSQGASPGTVEVLITGFTGTAVVDWGNSTFVDLEVPKGGSCTHDYGQGGFKRVRFDLGGTIRWADVDLEQQPLVTAGDSPLDGTDPAAGVGGVGNADDRPTNDAGESLNKDGSVSKHQPDTSTPDPTPAEATPVSEDAPPV